MHQNPIGNAYHEYASYKDFLTRLQQLWEPLPLDEVSAERHAIRFLKEAIAYKLYGNDLKKMHNIFKIVILLNERLQEYAVALEFCGKVRDRLDSVAQIVRKKIEDWQDAVGKREEVHKLRLVHSRIQRFASEIQWIENRIRRKKVEADEEKANQLFLIHRDLSPGALEKELAQAGIDPEVIEKFVTARRQERKKGIFQLFRF